MKYFSFFFEMSEEEYFQGNHKQVEDIVPYNNGVY